MSKPFRLHISLFLLRLGVFIVMGIWVLDKFLNPAHTQGVYSKFYFIEDLPATAPMIIGCVQGIIVLAFVAGIFKRYSYGLVLIMHLISTLSTWKPMFFNPYDGANILFFAAWPMLAAITALYLLRDEDKFLTVNIGDK